ncbi:MarR family winged helix-turn-helix transcriptional regulator [Skermania piniformis]|uniref:MarR family transcriptional regulator n=1 Tax=Skermania pinensis TaxID=39122 RepID=A0ABX8S9H9_9ACTN|nr:MarR family transcriptional regulator [Skermania piniformis]QXQ14428.1 MarR family transcriptional regulator [Skermania piniformis]
MKSVDELVVPAEQHVPMWMGFLAQQIREQFAGEDWGGLRQSHLRVLTSIPTGGVNITELAERVAMTKQGCGQFVGQLADAGLVRVRPDPADRRVRTVQRTRAGASMVRRYSRRIEQIEQDWASAVGPERYAVFRDVLHSLAAGGGNP